MPGLDDDALWWVPGADHPARRPTTRPRTARSSALGAAMLAVGEILEPHNTHVEIAAENLEPGDGLALRLDFGPLPPLR